ncbi:hypothetical protein PARPLA_00932 [Rhodobacteraceae bacterium THAF1]|nr:hypothetical protein FIU81_12755 [Palleronia sp. THAF1]VDC20093.1 hypothetical protein PARPLA_00932 [Rhodobacteraceae bacterium THAF1]
MTTRISPGMQPSRDLALQDPAGQRMRYAFVAEHRGKFSVRAMCRCLRIQPSGFYAWLRNPLSKRSMEDQRQTELLKEAWAENGKVYGHRKLHDDLLEQGESVCLNRVARLTRLAGIKARIGQKRRPGKYGGKPSVMIDNTLDRQFDVDASDNVWGCPLWRLRSRRDPSERRSRRFEPNGRRHHLHTDAGRLRLSRRCHRSLLKTNRRPPLAVCRQITAGQRDRCKVAKRPIWSCRRC